MIQKYEKEIITHERHRTFSLKNNKNSVILYTDTKETTDPDVLFSNLFTLNFGYSIMMSQ